MPEALRSRAMVKRSGFRTSRFVLGVAALLWTVAPSFAQQKPAPADPFQRVARAAFQGVVAAADCKNGKRFSVGLWPVPDDKSPLGASANRIVYQQVIAELLKARPKCVDVIDSVGVGGIADHLNKSGALDENGGNVLAALSASHQNVDFVYFPELVAQAGTVSLSLRGVQRETGRTVVQTAPAGLPAALLKEGASDAAVSLDAAVEAAASLLVNSVPGLKDLQLDGVFYETSGAQPPAGRYILDLLAGAITRRGSNPITGKLIRTRGIEIVPSAVEEASAADLNSDAVARRDGAYALSGRYWVRGDALDLNITLRAPDGGTTSWRGRVRLSDVRDLALRPVNAAVLSAPLSGGNYAFQVTTPRGASPTYRAREELNLLIRSAKPVWLYCFYVDSKAQVTPIVPVPAKFAGGETNRIDGGKLVRFPDPSKHPFRFRITQDTIGEEVVSCFGAARDVRSQLPATLFPDGLQVIPFLTLERVRSIFADLRDASIVESVVSINVTK